MKNQKYSCTKMIEWLLLEHRKSAWKINKKVHYKQFLPYAKKFVNTWIKNSLHGSSKIMMLETMKSINSLKTLESRYKNIHPNIWILLDDPTLREQVELDLIFGISIKEVHERLNSKIKPRVVDALAIKQFEYYFWNLDDNTGVFRPANVLELISENYELSKAYSHILKYFNDKNGKLKYEYHYGLINPSEPDLKKINTVIDLATIEQIDSFTEDNFDKIKALTEIQLLNCEVLKTLTTIQNNSSKQGLSDLIKLEEE